MDWIKNLLKKDFSTFVRFAVVGAVWTAINIGSDILLIDYLDLPGWLGAIISYVILYVGRYYTYLIFKVIEPQFWKYVYSTLVFTLIMWGMKVVAIDVLEYSAMVASTVITVLAFVLKYFFYKSINLLKTSEK